MDELLFEIYDRWYNHKYRYSSVDSDTITEHSTSETGWKKHENAYSTCSDAENRLYRRYNESNLKSYDKTELQNIIKILHHRTSIVSSRLVRQLKRRDHRLVRLQKNCDMLTAVLQAASQKRRQDTKLKFTIEPKPGVEAFQQWKDAMKAVARLPPGIPQEIRRKVWRSLADHHIQSQHLDWERTVRFVFNERSNPDDDNLGMQIVKDLHRTGCDRFCSEADRATLKRVLLAYARWNKKVGYCQGFNVLAALILEVTERNEDDALRIMLYLVDHVLPESYFSHNLQALSVDMAVFRDLMHIHLPELAEHLDRLQRRSTAQNTNIAPTQGYEPPLTNVFTMQWFLTLFATCLSPTSVLRVWDAVLLEGSEVMLRVALAIWEKLTDRIRKIDSADQFYSLMASLAPGMAEDSLIDTEELLQRVYSMAPFPFPNLAELREKYTYNITPFHIQLPAADLAAAAAAGNVNGSSRRMGKQNGVTDDDQDDDESAGGSISCFMGLWPQSSQQPLGPGSLATMAPDMSQIGPGAVSNEPSGQHPTLPTAYKERMNTNLSNLQAQYFRLKHRQRKAALVMPVSNGPARTSVPPNAASVVSSIQATPSIMIPSPMVNHLLLGQTHQNQQRKSAASPVSRRSATTVPPSSCASSRRSSTITTASINASPPLSPESRSTMSRTPTSPPKVAPQASESVSPGATTIAASLNSSPDSNNTETNDAVKSDCDGCETNGALKTDCNNSNTLLQLAENRVLSNSEESLNTAIARHNKRQQDEPSGQSSAATTPNDDTARWVNSSVGPSTESFCPSPSPPASDCDDFSETSSVQSSQRASTSSTNGTPMMLPPFTRRALRARINFGSQFGLYKAMTQTTAVRSNVNAHIQNSCLNQMRRDFGKDGGTVCPTSP